MMSIRTERATRVTLDSTVVTLVLKTEQEKEVEPHFVLSRGQKSIMRLFLLGQHHIIRKDVYIQGLSEGMLRIFSVSNEDEERSEATGRRGARTTGAKRMRVVWRNMNRGVEVFRLKTQRNIVLVARCGKS